MHFVQLVIIGLSAWVIVGGNAIWERLCPQKFWKLQVTELEKCAKKDLWNLKSIEWEVMKRRVQLSIAVSEAGDMAECLGGDCEAYKIKAKEEASEQLRKLMHEEAVAKTAYVKTTKLLNAAKENLYRESLKNR